MKPRRPTLEEIRHAAREIGELVVHAPLVRYNGGSGEIWIKPEVHQPIGSFKLRGVLHAAMQMGPTRRAGGLSTVSAGNTAQAVAWAGRHFGVPARSIMPDTAPAEKVEAVRAWGGEPVLIPRAEVFRYMRGAGWRDDPYAFIHPWTDLDVITGHATLGLEIVADCPAVDTVFVPVGGGGLLAGVGSAIKALRPQVKLVAVEPEGCASLHAALAHGGPVDVACNTICDGVAVPYITHELFPLLRDLIDASVLVSEQDVRTEMKRLAMHNRWVAEGAAAAAVAMPVAQRGVSVSILSGGNVNARLLAEILVDPDLSIPAMAR
ncbi:MAG: pyridoxal-phosphate dependent enzyme [Nannocystaceae bacterium]